MELVASSSLIKPFGEAQPCGSEAKVSGSLSVIASDLTIVATGIAFGRYSTQKIVGSRFDFNPFLPNRFLRIFDGLICFFMPDSLEIVTWLKAQQSFGFLVGNPSVW